MLKFDFSVRTQNGQRIDSVVIGGQDQADAERKLRQMYHHCEVLHCALKEADKKVWHAASIEEILTLISK